MKMNFKSLVSLSLLLGLSSVGMAFADPVLEKQHIDSAKDYARAGQWNYASYEWRAALSENPQSLPAIMGLADTLMQSEYPGEAVRFIEEARKTVQNKFLEQLYGKALEKAGRVADAERVYLHIMERSPLEVATYQRLMAIRPSLPPDDQKILSGYLEKTAAIASQSGRQALKTGLYDQAAANFAISTAYAPNGQDLNDYALVLLLSGQTEKALRQFGMLQKEQKESWQSYANLALVALGKNQPGLATQQMEKAISLCQDPAGKPMLYNNLGYIFENQSKWPEAINAYQHAMELNPRLIKARMNLAYAYQKNMDFKKSIETYRALLLEDPNNTVVMNKLGFVYELAHQERMALSMYRRAVEAKPAEQDGYYNLAILYRKMDKPVLADAEYKKLMELKFHQIEAGKGADKLARKSPTERSANLRLLDYVDVFFSPAVKG